MKTFHINQSALVAIANLAPDHDIQYYLMGVYVEFNHDTTRLVATDGHCLGVYEIAAFSVSDLPNDESGSLIVPLDLIAGLPKPASKHDPVLTFTKVGEESSLKWQVVIDGVDSLARPFYAVDGKYPDWRRVVSSLVNTGTNGNAAMYNLPLLNKLEKTATMLCRKPKSKGKPYIELYQSGYEAGLITVPRLEKGLFEAVVMPLRSETGKSGFKFSSSLTSNLV